MAGLTVYNGPPTNSLGVPTYSLGTGASAPTSNTSVQPSGGVQVQPSTNVMSYTGTSGSSPTAPSGGAPVAPTLYYDSAGNAFTDPSLATASDSRSTAVGDITTAENSAFGTAGTNFSNTANPFINTYRAQQTGIDQSLENSYLNRLSSIHDLLDTIKQGIQSFGVNLANRNASDSGAAEAGAKAYARQGQKGYGQINQSHALDLRNINTQQTNLGASASESARQIHQLVTDNVTAITNDTQMKLEQLNADAAYAGLSPIDVASMRDQIIADGKAKLLALDSKFSTSYNAIKPESQSAAEAAAYGLYNSGTPASGGYSFDIASPTWSGAPVSQVSPLPVFTRPKDQTPSLA